MLATSWSYYPAAAETAAVWALPRSLATTCGITFCFLLLRVLRCFSSPRSPPLQDDRPSACRVAPFGYPRIKGYLHLPTAFRSLSRPSSPPRAKASTVCPCLLSSSFTTFTDRVGFDISSACSSVSILFGCPTCQGSFCLPPDCSGFQLKVENNGFEPLTLCVQSRCSSQLS